MQGQSASYLAEMPRHSASYMAEMQGQFASYLAAMPRHSASYTDAMGSR